MAQAYTRRKRPEKTVTTEQPELARNSPAVRARRAATLLDNTELREQFDKVRQALIIDLELAKLDGSREAEAAALETIRQLQALHSIKAKIMEPLLLEMQRNNVNRT